MQPQINYIAFWVAATVKLSSPMLIRMSWPRTSGGTTRPSPSLRLWQVHVVGHTKLPLSSGIVGGVVLKDEVLPKVLGQLSRGIELEASVEVSQTTRV